MGDLNVAAVLRRHASARPDGIALQFQDRRTSYGTFWNHARQVAAGLDAAGLRPGERIAVLAKNSNWFFELLVGAASAGVVTIPLNWRLTRPELACTLADCGARALFASADFMAHARALVDDAAHVGHLIEIVEGDDPTRHFTAWRDHRTAADAPTHEAGWNDILIQLYTSGTTGRPKGVMLSHGAFISARRIADQGRETWDKWGPENVALLTTPVFHVSGTATGLTSLYGGGKAAILEEFDKDAVFDTIEREGVTHLMVVPSTLQTLLNDPRAKTTDLSSIRQVLYGASPMPMGLLERCLQQLDCEFVQLYGMTETFGAVVALRPEDHRTGKNNRLASTGQPMEGVEIRITGAGDAVVAAGTVGEIQIRTETVMLGYWNLPEETSVALSEDGWVRTGDAGYLDHDGYLFICDRIKDMIISGAENIYPIEVENAISTHPAVGEVAVIGVPDPRWGEAVKALVVPRRGCSTSEEELIAYAKQRIASYKAPKSVEFVATLPRSPSGKVLKRELRTPYWEGQGHTRAVA